MAKHVSAYRGAGLNPNRVTKKPKQDWVSAYKRDEEKNRGGLIGGLGYVGGNLGLGIAGIGEGVGDLISAGGDLLRGDTDMAKYRFLDNRTAEAQQSLRDWYNPGSVMEFAGDVASGIGQSSVFLLDAVAPGVGTGLFFAGVGGQGISSAAAQTGDVGWREVGYGVASGVTEGLLERALGAGSKVAGKLGASITRKAGTAIGQKGITTALTKSAGKRAWSSIAKATAKDAAGEFAEEFASEYIDTALLHAFGIDPNASTSFGEAVRAGMVGLFSGGIMGAPANVINYKNAAKAGRTIRESGETENLLNRAQATVSVLREQEAVKRAEGKKVKKTDEGTEADEQKGFLARQGAKREARRAAEYAAKLEKNVNAYRNMKAEMRNSEVGDALLGELRGNLYFTNMAYAVEEAEIVLRNVDDAQAQKIVDYINTEAKKAKQEKSDYTVEDFRLNRDGILSRFAARGRMEQLVNGEWTEAEEMAAQAAEATESPVEAAGEAGAVTGEDVSVPEQAAPAEESEAVQAKAETAEETPVDHKARAEKLLREMGETVSLDKLATAIAKKQTGEALDANERLLLKDNRKAELVLERMQRESRQKKAPEKAEAKPEEQKQTKGTVTVSDGMKPNKDFSDVQYATYKAAGILADSLGLSIEIHKSLERNGKTVNGYYDTGTKVLHVNINAMRDGKQIALYTLGHELTHYIKDWSPEKFNALADFVAEQMGTDMETAVDEKMASLRRLGLLDKKTTEQAAEMAREEVVADGMELILTDGRVLDELAKTDKSLWEKVRDWIKSTVAKIRKYYGELNQASKTAQVLKETMDSLDELERLFTEGVREAGERTRTAGVETRTEGEKVYSFAPADFEKPITMHDIEVLRGIGRRSINKFSSEDIKKAQKWAYKFYKEMGTKSPFFRAWFGDWRAYDTKTKIPIVPVNAETIERGDVPRGDFKNKDTGWNITSNSDGIDETANKEQKRSDSYHALKDINDLLKNAVLLDTVVVTDPSKRMGKNAALMHHMYCPISVNGEIGVAKLYIAESLGDKQKFYLMRIEKASTAMGFNTENGESTPHSIAATDDAMVSIAQIFEFVKEHHEDFEKNSDHYVPFEPKPVNELMLNENKEPRVFYHGTRSQFTEFILQDKPKFGRALGDGFYFTPSYSKAHQFANGLFSKGQDRGGIVMPVYLRMEKPFVIEETADRTKWRNEYHKGDYDGIIDLKNQTWYVEGSTQIKSATENIGTFDADNPDIRYSIDETTEAADVSGNAADANVSGNEEEITDRDMLLAMAEQLVGNAEENKILSDYKAQYDTQKERQKKLDSIYDEIGEQKSMLYTSPDATQRSAAAKRLKELYVEMNDVSQELAGVDRELTKIEGMKAVRNLLVRERKTSKKIYQEKYERMNKARREATETTELRRQTRRIYNRLYRMLAHPTKTKNVPYEMQGITADALRAANMDLDALERLEQLEEQLSKLEREGVPDPDKIAKKEKEIKAQEKKVGSMKEQIQVLVEIFEKSKEINTGVGANVYSDDALAILKDLQTEIGNVSIRNANREQLASLKKFYDTLYTRINNANKAFATEKATSIDQMSTKANTQVKEAKSLKFLSPKPMEITGKNSIRRFFWKNMKPLTVFEAIGSDELMSIFKRVLDGEDVWITDILEAKKALDEAKKKYGYNKWNFKERREVTTADGSKVSLTLGEMMSLYAYMFREQAEEHLSAGGFVFAPDAKSIEKFKDSKVLYEAHLNDQTPHRMRKEDIAKMSEMLTQEQRAYAEAVQKYLTGLGEKGNEVSRKLYGIDLFKETAYFPIKSSHDYIETSTGKSGDPNIKSRGTFKETVPGAGNPIVLEDFMEVVGNHVNTMATYHAFVLPVEDLTRVWNYTPVNIKRDADGKAILDENGMPVADTEGAVGYNSLKAEITKKYGKEANDYILQLLRDLNGGARRESAASILDKGLTAFKRSATMLSLSTIVQQPTSIIRAMAYVDAKHFTGASFVPWETVKKYAPVAAIKEVGGHDTNTGARTVDYINAKEYDSIKDAAKAAVTPEIYGGDPNVRAEAFGWLTGKADEVSWRYMFGAIINEQAEKLGKPKESEEVMKAAGERFAEVVRRTQVYDSTLTRSEFMRSKDGLMKMATAFGAEPTTVVSMVADAIIKAERGDKTFLRKSAAGIAFSVIANAAVVSLIYAMRDDDEDETIPEKYVQSLTSELIEGFNFFEYLPVARDVVSLFKGYEIERSDMALVGNLMDQVELITSSKRSVPDKIFGVTGAVSAFFGLPVTNVYRDFKGLVKTGQSFTNAEKQTGAGFGFAMGDAVSGQFNLFAKLFGAESGNDYELYTAYVDGDTAHYNRVKARYEDEKAAEQALRKELRENDRRIGEAAKARMNGETELYESIVRAIVSEGIFDRNMVIRAVNNEISALERELEKGTLVPEDPEAEDTPEALYKASDLNAALERGDRENFELIYDTILGERMEQGKTEAQAKAAVKSSITAYWKKQYLSGYQDTETRKRIIKLLTDTGLYGSRNDVATMCEGWVKAKK